MLPQNWPSFLLGFEIIFIWMRSERVVMVVVPHLGNPDMYTDGKQNTSPDSFSLPIASLKVIVLFTSVLSTVLTYDCGYLCEIYTIKNLLVGYRVCFQNCLYTSSLMVAYVCFECVGQTYTMSWEWSQQISCKFHLSGCHDTHAVRSCRVFTSLPIII